MYKWKLSKYRLILAPIYRPSLYFLMDFTLVFLLNTFTCLMFGFYQYVALSGPEPECCRYPKSNVTQTHTVCVNSSPGNNLNLILFETPIDRRPYACCYLEYSQSDANSDISFNSSHCWKHERQHAVHAPGRLCWPRGERVIVDFEIGQV